MPTAPKHRDKIIRAAADLFRRAGYAATGTNEIVARSGAPKGSLYHYFPGGKAEIGAAAIGYAGSKVTATLADLLARHDGNPAAAILAYGALLIVWLEQSGYRDGCPIATVLLEIAPAETTVTAAGRAVFADWAGLFAKALMDSHVAAERAETLGTLAVTLLEGSLIQARVEADGRAITLAVREAAGMFEAAMSQARQ
ncbi:TetR/AcrR family transcriptional regulator [Phreatobacter stygius]|uniref:TetR/AcrR family transcriptional regulator n=1 Tax=Phreatobacter stygius TaxID=1940610 RepID=A0A4D7AV06_9HYPH|nr:TetR/AcrR family transcriptional regulator [Phreatobacter stygius]QCI63435.1 TetR/AcrR family transcriptional regulator [Phreatobacter stygius]